MGAVSRHLAAALQGGGKLICTDISAPLQQEARRALKKFSNVEFKLGDDSAINVPEHSLDLALVHFALRAIPAQDRPQTLRTLRQALKPQGRLVLREAVNTGQGLPVAEIERLSQQAGFRILEHHVGKVSPLRPLAYTGVMVQDTRNN
jgi:ubiquinone/menaquinone biosynthesis C-methylase UbiE